MLSIFAVVVNFMHPMHAILTDYPASGPQFLCRTIPNLSDPLEEVIRYKFLPAITGQSALSDVERDLLALPSHPGGLGVINPVTSK